MSLTASWLVFLVVLIIIIMLTYYDVIPSNIGTGVGVIFVMVGFGYLSQQHRIKAESITPDNATSGVAANFYSENSESENLPEMDNIYAYEARIMGNGKLKPARDTFFKNGGNLDIKNIKTPDLVKLDDNDLLYMLTKINRAYDDLYTSNFGGSIEDPLDLKLKAFGSYQFIVNEHKKTINKKLKDITDKYEMQTKPLIADIEREQEELKKIKELNKQLDPELLKQSINNSIPIDSVNMSPEQIKTISDANAILYKIAVSKAIIRDINKKYSDNSFISLLFDASKEARFYELKDKFIAEKKKLTTELNKYI